MTNKYQTLFTIELLHSYYTDGKCSDLTIEAVAASAKAMQGLQLISRNSGNMNTVLFKTDGGSLPHIPVDKETTFTFSLRLKEPRFINITDNLPGSNGLITIYTNTTNTAGADGKTELDAEEAVLCGPFISYTITSNNKVTISLEDESGAAITSHTYSAGSRDEVHRFDISAHEAGVYRVIEDDGTTVNEQLYYCDAQLAAAKVLAVARITNRTANPFGYTGSEKYKITFTPVSHTWSYYVVAENLTNAEFASLAVTDQGFGTTEDSRAQIVFDAVTPIPPADKTPGYLTSNTGRVALFTSAAAIAMREKPRKQIKLMKSGSALVGNLPNPSPDAANAEMFIYL